MDDLPPFPGFAADAIERVVAGTLKARLPPRPKFEPNTIEDVTRQTFCAGGRIQGTVLVPKIWLDGSNARDLAVSLRSSVYVIDPADKAGALICIDSNVGRQVIVPGHSKEFAHSAADMVPIGFDILLPAELENSMPLLPSVSPDV